MLSWDVQLHGLLLWSFVALLAFLVSRSSLRNIGLLGALLGLLVSRGRSISSLFGSHVDDVALLMSGEKLIFTHRPPLCSYLWRWCGGQVGAARVFS